MLETAIKAMRLEHQSAPQHNQPRVWTLSELRKATGIAIRSQYRLSEQLKADRRVIHHSGNRFTLVLKQGSTE